MVKLGWPIAVRGGDWNASALNLAVFRGDAGLDPVSARTWGKLDRAAWLWRQCLWHAFLGVLQRAGRRRRLVGCARALLDHGMPRAKPDQNDPEWILIDGRRKRFSDEVTEILLDGS